MSSITINAPAKINLYLDVIKRRPDGYHNIKTVFQKINLHDRIVVTKINKGIRLNCRYHNVPSGKANIAYRAAYIMKKKFRLKSGIAIDIVKKIPPAAGLGGGSSDAAAVITGIKRLFDLKVSSMRFIRIAKDIGADVPFFISGYNCAIGEGIGDRLKRLNHKRRFYLLLVKPSLSLYTNSIYSRLRLPLTKKPHSVIMLARALSRKNKEIRRLLYNRLEEVVLPAYPIVRKIKDALSLFETEGVLLSGSGPTVFALFNRRKEAIKAKDRIKRDGIEQLILTKTF